MKLSHTLPLIVAAGLVMAIGWVVRHERALLGEAGTVQARWDDASAAIAFPSPHMVSEPGTKQTHTPASSASTSRPILQIATSTSREPVSTPGELQFRRYRAIADCATWRAEWRGLRVEDQARASAQALRELIRACTDNGYADDGSAQADTARRMALAHMHPAARAETLFDLYRAGDIDSALALANQLKAERDPRVVEALMQFHRMLHREQLTIGESVPLRYRHTAEAGWQIALCTLGKPCGPDAPQWLEACATRELCGVTSIAEWLNVTLPESEVPRAHLYSGRILALLAANDYAQLGWQ